MNVSDNNFAKNQPIKSSNVFSESKPVQSSNTFTEDKPSQDLHYWGGDNITGSAPGTDFATFGEIIGSEPIGGFRHFLNRTNPNQISH